MIPGTAEAYISAWLPYIEKSRVICGGILYHESPPGDPDKILRWKIGLKREQRRASERNKHPYAMFSTFNVMIDRTIFSKLRFNEELKQYGFEDTLLSYQLKKADIGILHIDNALLHDGLESNKEFLIKTKLSLENLSRLYDSVTDKRTLSSTLRIVRLYKRLALFRLTLFLAGFYIRYKEKMEIRLDSPKPSLLLFSIYKVCMFCTFREIHARRKILPIF
jgi:hypothetical protein